MRISLPEQVWIDLEPATFGSRALAYFVDFLIRWTFCGLLLAFISIVILYGFPQFFIWEASKQFSNALLATISTIIVFAIEWSYPIYYEVFRNGISPGKRALGLQVVDESGLPITLRASVLRTILSLVDLMPGLGVVACISMMLSKKSQRLGDLVAGTMVVHHVSYDEVEQDLRSESQSSTTTVLPLELYNIIERFLRRKTQLTPKAQSSTLHTLTAKIRQLRPDIVPWTEETDQAQERWLLELFNRSRPGKITEAKSKQDVTINWKQIAKEFDEAEQAFNSLASARISASEQTLFTTAGQYQRLCQRYAYLSTFYPQTSEAVRAAKLVRKGRTLIYSKRLSHLDEARTPLLSRAPASFAHVSRHTALAATIATVSALLCALLVQVNPNLLWHFLSEEAAARLSKGSLWTEEIRGISSVASSKILTNNISVTLSAFALGITGGIGTVIILIFNGAHLGGIFSALTFYKMSYPLFSFIVAHGFLELSVIIVAGGCGLYLGDAILHPGNLSRKRALQRNAGRVVDLLLFNALCLVVAGIVEGYISPYNEIPFAFRLSLGLTLFYCYWSYLLTRKIFWFPSDWRSRFFPSHTRD